MRRGYVRVRRGYVGCGVAMFKVRRGYVRVRRGYVRVRRGYVEGAAWLCSGCGVAMWLARRAAVRQSRVRISPGTPPLVQPRKIQEQKSFGADFSSAAAGVSAHHQG